MPVRPDVVIATETTEPTTETPVVTGPTVQETVDVAPPVPAPTEKSTHAQIDAYASSLGVDLTGKKTKTEKLAAITAAS